MVVKGNKLCRSSSLFANQKKYSRAWPAGMFESSQLCCIPTKYGLTKREKCREKWSCTSHFLEYLNATKLICGCLWGDSPLSYDRKTLTSFRHWIQFSDFPLQKKTPNVSFKDFLLQGNFYKLPIFADNVNVNIKLVLLSTQSHRQFKIQVIWTGPEPKLPHQGFLKVFLSLLPGLSRGQSRKDVKWSKVDFCQKMSFGDLAAGQLP